MASYTEPREHRVCLKPPYDTAQNAVTDDRADADMRGVERPWDIASASSSSLARVSWSSCLSCSSSSSSHQRRCHCRDSHTVFQLPWRVLLLERTYLVLVYGLSMKLQILAVASGGRLHIQWFGSRRKIRRDRESSLVYGMSTMVLDCKGCLISSGLGYVSEEVKEHLPHDGERARWLRAHLPSPKPVVGC